MHSQIALVAVASLALCLVWSVRSPNAPDARKYTAAGRATMVLVCLLGGALFGLAATNRANQASGMVPDTLVSALLAHSEPQLRAALARPTLDVLILVNGSSTTYRGVDDRILEIKLESRTELDIEVVQLALPGANHIERYSLLRQLMSRLSREERLRLGEVRLVLLWEEHRRYDSNPLSQFTENRDSARTYGYMDPASTYLAIRSLVPPRTTVDAIQIMHLLRHAAVHVVNLGARDWQVPSVQLPLMRGYRPKPGNLGGFRVVALDASWIKAQDMQAEQPFPALETAVIPAYLRLLAPGRPELIYFAPPSMDVRDMAYVSAVCHSRPANACITSNARLMHRLSDNRYWWDGSHMSVLGARLYTRWLASRLVPRVR